MQPRRLPSTTGLFRVLLLTACATTAVFVLSETRARRLGYEPNHPWLPGMWTHQRFQLETLPDDHTVLLGASRIQFGIHLDTWETRTGMRPLILAWPGAPFGPMLTDLAQNTNFRGTAICNIAPSFVFAAEATPRVAAARLMVTGLESQRISAAYQVGQPMRILLQENLCMLNPPAFSPIEALRQALRLPNRERTRIPVVIPPAWYTDRELQLRFTPQLYESADMRNQLITLYRSITSLQKSFGPCNIERWLEQARADVQAIEKRGGRVIFLRIPSSGYFLQFERDEYPRTQYWDRVLQETGCTGVHFEDYDNLAHYTCPEESHMSATDAIEYTDRVLDILQGQHAP